MYWPLLFLITYCFTDTHALNNWNSQPHLKGGCHVSADLVGILFARTGRCCFTRPLTFRSVSLHLECSVNAALYGHGWMFLCVNVAFLGKLWYPWTMRQGKKWTSSCLRRDRACTASPPHTHNALKVWLFQFLLRRHGYLFAIFLQTLIELCNESKHIYLKYVRNRTHHKAKVHAEVDYLLKAACPKVF